MSSQAAERKLLEVLAEEFVARYRRGERPPLSEYIEAHPELAHEIRELFPTLVLMEELAPSDSDSEAASVTATLDPSPLTLGDHRLLREVGRGGMGIVYEAEQLSLGRRVALKVLHRHTAGDSTVRQRFHREARAAAQLHHTNIVPVFEVGEDQDACWYAMQLILGQGLDQIIEELRQQRQALSGESLPSGLDAHASAHAQLSQVTQALVSGQFACPDLEAAAPPSAPTDVSALPAELDTIRSVHRFNRSELSAVDSASGQYYRSVARIGRQAADALAYAHGRGIIHRDVKPSNLLLDTAGVLWITDFGLAKTRDTSLTTTGDIVGTLRYMAPERFQGEGDPRADVYGLGLTLYELLVLRPAFVERDRLQLIDQIKNREPVRPRVLDRHVPRDLETIILKAIDKEAKRRYASAEALAEDLRRFLADEPIQARRTSEMERLRLWGRRNPAVASLLVVVLLLFVCLTVGSLTAAFWLNHQRLALAAAEEDRTEKLYQSLVAQANASRFSRQVGQRMATLDAVRKATELVCERHMPAERLDELRTLAIAALVLPDFQTLRTWEGCPDVTFAWDADNSLRRYARIDLDGNISLRWIDSDAEIAHLRGWPGEMWALFSPDGRFLMVWRTAQFRVWDLSVEPPHEVREGEHRGAIFHPDGRHLLVKTSDGSLVLHDLTEAPSSTTTLARGSSSLVLRAFDPTGARLAVTERGKVRILDTATGKNLTVLPELQSSLDIAWHPSGQYLALVTTARELHVWDLRREKLLSTLKGCRNGGIGLAFTPDGEKLLTGGWEGVIRVWDWRTGRQVLQQPGSSNLRCRDDGRLLIKQDHHLLLVELTTGRAYRSFVQQASAGKDVDSWRIDIHPSGRVAVVASSDGTHLFDLESCEELGFMPVVGFGHRFQGREALLTNDSCGVFRWPIQAEGASPNRWRLGPPHLLRFGTRYTLDCDTQGRVIGQPVGSGGVVIRADESMIFLGPQSDTRGIAVSAEGNYAATLPFHGDDGVKVWDTATGQRLAHFAVGGQTLGAFSPDGQWLSIKGTRGCRIVKVGTWEERPLTVCGIFSPDSSILAAGLNSDIIHFLEPATGRELARLTDPNQDRPIALAFTPDGGKLLVNSDDAHALHLWDLRAIRTELAAMGLDWDLPPLPPAPPPSAEPLHIDIDLGQYPQTTEAIQLVRQAVQLSLKQRQPAQALTALRKAVQLAPDLAVAQNNLAWLLLTGPQELRDPAQGLAAARKAVALDPRQVSINTLGVALYRTGQFAEAVSVLERSLEQSQGRTDAFDLFFLAMCHHRLGNAARAKECHDLATRWFAEHKDRLRMSGWLDELASFQTESDATLAQPPGPELK